jgi:hypothetical protein
MSDYSTVKVETAYSVTELLQKEDDDKMGKNLTKLFMPGFSIFALYLLIASAALYSIFAEPIRNLLEKNLIAKHILGYMTMLFFVVLSQAVEVNYPQAIGFTFFVYLWFVMTTKLSLSYWFISIFILGALYALQLYKQTEEDLPHKQKKMITQIEYGGTIIGFLITVVGFVSYYYDKKDKHGNGFRLHHFFNGKYD